MKAKFFPVLVIFLLFFSQMISAETSQKIYDFAGLLSSSELEQLETLATMYSDENQVDIVVLTTNSTNGKGVKQFMQDFYDDAALGYDKPHGDTVILTIDMEERNVYVAGFYKGMKYVDDLRAESIREGITPYLSEGNFFSAFTEFIELTDHYLGIEPVVPSPTNDSYKPPNTTRNPNVNNQHVEDNIFYETWFQLLISLVIAGGTVGIMAYHSSGRKTTNSRTYLDESRSAVTAKTDRFVRTTVTKRRKPKNNNNGGGGFGGGGMTRGGRSHSGSRGKF